MGACRTHSNLAQHHTLRCPYGWASDGRRLRGSDGCLACRLGCIARRSRRPARQGTRRTIVLDRTEPPASAWPGVLASAGYSTKTFDESRPKSCGRRLLSRQIFRAGCWLPMLHPRRRFTRCSAARMRKDLSRSAVLRHGQPVSSPASSSSLGGDSRRLPTTSTWPPSASKPASWHCSTLVKLATLTSISSASPTTCGQPLLPLRISCCGAPRYSTQISNVAGRDAAEARLVKLWQRSAWRLVSRSQQHRRSHPRAFDQRDVRRRWMPRAVPSTHTIARPPSS